MLLVCLSLIHCNVPPTQNSQDMESVRQSASLELGQIQPGAFDWTDPAGVGLA